MGCAHLDRTICAVILDRIRPTDRGGTLPASPLAIGCPIRRRRGQAPSLSDDAPDERATNVTSAASDKGAVDF